jgi:hypothetical protein
MVGEGVIPFKPTDSNDPRFRQGKRAPIVLPKGLLVGPIRLPFDRSVEAPDSVF